MALSPGVFVGTLGPDGKLQFDHPNDYRNWTKAQMGKIALGEVGTRYVVTIEEQYSAEARKFYFRILKWLRDGEMAGWVEADQHTFFKNEFNEGRSIQELSRERFDEFIESVIQWAAEHGLAVPPPNKRYETEGDGL